MSVVSSYFSLPKFEMPDPGILSCDSRGPIMGGISYQAEVSSSCSFPVPFTPKIEPAPSPEILQYQTSPNSSQLPSGTLYSTTPPYPPSSSQTYSPDPTPSYLNSQSPYHPADLSPEQSYTQSPPRTVSPLNYPTLSYPPADHPSPYLTHPSYTFSRAETTRMYPTDQCKAPTDMAPWKSEVQYPVGGLVGRIGELMEAGDMDKLVELVWSLPPPSPLDDETIFRAHVYVAYYTRQYLQVDNTIYCRYNFISLSNLKFPTSKFIGNIYLLSICKT